MTFFPTIEISLELVLLSTLIGIKLLKNAITRIDFIYQLENCLSIQDGFIQILLY